MKIGIILGKMDLDTTGYELVKEGHVDTPYGKPSDVYSYYKFRGKDVFVLKRNGPDQKMAPNMVNYRANIEGFIKLGVSKIISLSAVGVVNKEFHIGDIVVSDNGIDITSGRMSSFHESVDDYRVDLVSPFCEATRKQVIAAAAQLRAGVKTYGVYLCSNGLRTETSAEANAYRIWGADVVGHTLFPECVLAKERGLCYVSIGLVRNMASGIQQILSADMIKTAEELGLTTLKRLINSVLMSNLNGGCKCGKDRAGGQ